ncbi:error-prone DNA polymerase [Parasphingopyxis sp. CP4]|uniref:error-prone DNA polymerase n=1 Tax=Parasphingopyxis sp. CP4 TaxID=2724527 RepID=UPI0015A27C12|nr:error-prone DNA polymerase [Parasphingopyxis sp. CP4]QLC22291.1 error-prone DNA polymerase [Parasphingopyxis sp. CP4]
MPDIRLIPAKRSLRQIGGDFAPNPPTPFVELGITSCFSFLRGASDAVDLVLAALAQGYDAIGIADRNTMAGIVRMHVEAKEARIRPVIGCRLDLIEGLSFLAYPKDRVAYGRLCALLSRGKMTTSDGEWQEKGECHLTLAMLADHARDVQLILIPPEDLSSAYHLHPGVPPQEDSVSLVAESGTVAQLLPMLVEHLPSLGHIAASYLYRGGDRARIAALDRLARDNGLSILATNDVHYHAPDRRPLQDVMTCIREKTVIDAAGLALHANAERHLKSPDEMVRLFADWPHAIAATRAVADACDFSLDELKYEYPEDTVPDGRDPQEYLTELAWAGAEWRYPDGVSDKVCKLIRHELRLIEKLDIARYFLTIRDIVRFARRQDPPILCQGRGSAANSAVCFCLGITSVDPTQVELLFERFVSEERKEPPDIDVDFEHERREEVIQHIYERYGRDHAGLCATVIHYRPRSAIREVGKAMGLSEDVTSALARTVWGSWGSSTEAASTEEAGLDLDDPYLRRVIRLTDQLIGMPRHLSQHVGGFILTREPLIETVPVGNGAMADRSFIEWDKDDIEALGILKVDVLALGMLTCIRKALDLIAAHHGKRYTLASVPREVPTVYDMLCKADTVGVFQIESRAQMSMLPHLKPRCYYDLVIEVAIVRPGPIQGDMVHPYLRRRSGKEKVSYPSPAPDKGPPDELERILSRTLGVPIFQEQAMKIAIDAAKFTPAEANQLRKAMATFRSRGTIGNLEDKMVGRMIERGYEPDFAKRCFDQIKGFGDYGFPESHSASFADLAYVSSWIKCFYPDAFAAALLNSQPMGFYAPAQIVRDARQHGVDVRPPDVNFSDWDNLLEPIEPGRWAVRLGLRQISGVRQDDAARIMAARTAPYGDVEDLKNRAGISVAAVQKLAAADCFRSMTLDRRQALWDSRALKAAPDLPLFSFSETRDEGSEVPVMLPAMPLCEHVVADYQTLRLSLKAHPFEFLRGGYEKRGFTRNVDLKDKKFGARVSIAGIVLIRQRPGTANGVCFVTLEDESGIANLVIWPDVMTRFRKVIMGARLFEVHGTVQRNEDVIHVIAVKLVDATPALLALSDDLLEAEVDHADHVLRPVGKGLNRHPRDVQLIPKSRDFH